MEIFIAKLKQNSGTQLVSTAEHYPQKVTSNQFHDWFLLSIQKIKSLYIPTSRSYVGVYNDSSGWDNKGKTAQNKQSPALQSLLISNNKKLQHLKYVRTSA